MTKFFQYAFWPNCDNNCPFCINKGKTHLNAEQQKSVIDDILKFIVSDAQDNGCIDISFIGGEFFSGQIQDPAVKDSFYAMMDICVQLCKRKMLRRLMVCTSLIYDMNLSLRRFIDYAEENGIMHNLMICTSYDTKYRFHDEAAEETWKCNMLQLKDENVSVHTEIILMKDTIEKMLNGSFDVIEFQRRFCTHVDFIEPTYVSYYQTKQHTVDAIPGFFPCRQQFIDLVQKKCLEDNQIDLNGFLSLKVRSRYVRFKNWEKGCWLFVDDRWRSNCRRYDSSGNPVKIYTYSDSDRSMADDIDLIKGGII